MLEKAKYLEEQIAKKLQFWNTILLLLAMILFLLLGVMDYLATPENFTKFIFYRIGISLILIVLYYLNSIKQSILYQQMIISTMIIMSAITIELMIIPFGGHTSPYYAGMNLLIIGALGLIPFNTPLTILMALSIYAIYIIPILLFDTLTNIPAFVMNNTFMFSTFVIALTLRILTQRSMINELSLQYDLTKEKGKLEKYSTQLEDLVVERTKELSVSEQRFRELFDNANDGIAVLNTTGIIINVNRKFCELHGFDKNALIGIHFSLLEGKDREGQKEERWKSILNGEAIVYESEHYKKDGNAILLEVSSTAIDIGGELYIQSFHRDITEKKQLQEQLFQAQKMESIGTLAGGIAHDFKNILMAILGHADLLSECDTLTDKARQSVRIIENSARKAGHIISNLLSFSRKESFEILPLNLNDVIRDAVELCESISKKRNVEIKMEANNDIPCINADNNQLEQVLMNLFVNAMDAMPNGGEIIITTGFLELEEKAAGRIHPLLTAGKYVLLKVSDTGTGIPDEIKDKIFNPFFTTKEAGKGTGLGLAMVYGIIKEHKGIIDVKSKAGKGTTFEIYLPAFTNAAVVQEVSKTTPLSMKGNIKILVVDDDAGVLSFVKEVLEKEGYRLIATDNPYYALEVFGDIADGIDLIITDINMPLMDGKKLIKHFKAIKPTVKTIAISAQNTHHLLADKSIDAFINKPFKDTHLISMMNKVIGSKDSGLKFN